MLAASGFVVRPLLLLLALSRASLSAALLVTFVNELPDIDCHVFYKGVAGEGLQMMWGPLTAGGGAVQLDSFPGHEFTFAAAGTLAPLVEHTIRDGVEVATPSATSLKKNIVTVALNVPRRRRAVRAHAERCGGGGSGALAACRRGRRRFRRRR